MNRRKQVKLSTWSFSLKRVGDELWSCQRDGITVFTGDLEEQRKLLPQTGYVTSAALMPDNNVLVSCRKGLIVVTKEGMFSTHFMK